MSSTSLGSAIRSARKTQGLTLVQVAHTTGLSHPFLSQVERDLSQPSMRSLYLIAQALGTTQHELLNAAADSQENPAEFVPGMRVLSAANSPADFTEYSAVTHELTDFFVHAKEEYLYVVSGSIEIEISESAESPTPSTKTTLGFRQSVRISSNHFHRYRSTSTQHAILISMHVHPDS